MFPKRYELLIILLYPEDQKHKKETPFLFAFVARIDILL